MSEMIDKVARAIGEDLYGHCTPEDTPNTWACALGAARIAIKAMREPTKHMLMASGLAKTQQGKWQAMIDEALR